MIKKEVANKVEKKMPEEKFRAGNVTATIWKHEVKTDDKEFDSYNVVFEKNYTDKEEKWQTTNSYNKNDLIKLKVVLDKAIEELFLQENASE